MVEELRANPEVEFSEVNDIVRGYELKQIQTDEETLYALEPAWFFEESGEWRSVKEAGTGGGMGGLE